MRKFSIILFTAIILLTGIFTIVQPVEAAAWDVHLVPDCGAGGCNVCDAIGVGINITKIMLGTLGSAALLVFVYGGVLMATSRGHSDQIQHGKDALTNAVKGVIIVLGSWVVINYGLAMLLVKPGENVSFSNVKLFDNTKNWATVACEPSGAGADAECKGKTLGTDCKKDSAGTVTHKCNDALKCVPIL